MDNCHIFLDMLLQLDRYNSLHFILRKGMVNLGKNCILLKYLILYHLMTKLVFTRFEIINLLQIYVVREKSNCVKFDTQHIYIMILCSINLLHHNKGEIDWLDIKF